MDPRPILTEFYKVYKEKLKIVFEGNAQVKDENLKRFYQNVYAQKWTYRRYLDLFNEE